MAWTLRQSVEGDKFVSVANVANDSSSCWVDSNGEYIPNTIAIEIDDIEYILYNVRSLGFGFLSILIPNNVYIKGNTSIRVYPLCADRLQYQTLKLNAKPVNLQLRADGITTCNNQVILEANKNQYVRLFFANGPGNYLRIQDLSGNNLDVNQFSYQEGSSENIISTSGFFSRSYNVENPSILFQNIPYTENSGLQIRALSNLYSTVRIDGLELLFTGHTLRYTNYSFPEVNEVYLTEYNSTGDSFTVFSVAQSYIILKNNTEILRIQKVGNFNVSGGIIVPHYTGNYSDPAIWTLPKIAGDYTVTLNIGEGFKYTKTITVHGCGTAVDDHYTSGYNVPIYGNVSDNDILCEGEESYVQILPDDFIGMQNYTLSPNGEFYFQPTTNFTGTAFFRYERFCGKDGVFEKIGSAGVYINYDSNCTSTEPEWSDTGKTRCINCYKEKEQEDLNSECSNTIENKWIPTTGECISEDNWESTTEFRCKYGHKYIRQINLNRCTDDDYERWTDVGISTDCECIGEIFINTCCGKANYFPIIKLLDQPNEENRAIDTCLVPQLGEDCLINASLKFKSLNDGEPHTYLITLFDCNQKLINQIQFEDYNCAGQTSGFTYTFDFNV